MKHSILIGWVTLSAIMLASAAVDDGAASPLVAAARESVSPPGDTPAREQRGVIGFLGKLHPLAVHFPIALIVMAGITETLYMRRPSATLASAVRVMLLAAAAFAVVSTALGFAAANSRTFSPGLNVAFGVHRVAGIVTAGVAVLAAALVEGARTLGEEWRWQLYRVVLFIALIAVVIAAHSGATLVFGKGYFGVF
jgi:uncharacterized membrane protein